MYFNDRRDFSVWVGGFFIKGSYRGVKVVIVKVEMNFIYKNWYLIRFVVC